MFSAIAELREALEGQDAVRKQLAQAGITTPWVFMYRTTGAQIESFSKAWRSAAARAGCPGRIPHDFRRTAVRNLSRAGMPDTIAMKLTGHKTRAVFDRYDITRRGPRRAASW